MSISMSMRRSTLNPLVPVGVGTRDIESLLSYFFRLALSHCVSAPDLQRMVAVEMQWQTPGKYRWDNLNLDGINTAADQWSRGLAKLTCVERLDVLTLLPWRNVIAHRKLFSTLSRWCPACFAHDRAGEHTPYFRLAWGIEDVDACSHHKILLVNVCLECGRTKTRNNSAYVVPGWCCFCGAFLGDTGNSILASEAQIWKASQIGRMLAAQAILHSPPTRETIIEGFFSLVERLDDGNSALFARRIGLNRSTVHYWLKQGGVPTLAAHLRIASQTGLALPEVLTGAVGTLSSTRSEQFELTKLFPEYKKRASPQARDLSYINSQLDALSRTHVSVSVKEAARRLNIHPRQLYQITNEKSRSMGARWKSENLRRGEQSRERVSQAIENAFFEIVAEGKAPNLRQLRRHIPKKILGSTRGVIDLLRRVKKRTEVE
jgi:hypothetical protein